MPVPRCTEQEFIALWHQNPSAQQVADILKTDVRAVCARRRGIEKRRGIRLAAADKRSPDFMLITHDRVEVKLGITNGVVLVSGDLHFRPKHDVPVMHRAMCYLAKKLKPYAIVWNGDVADFPQISRHPSIGWENYPTVAEEIETIGDRSKEVMQAAPAAKRIWTAGNHCLRMESRIANTLPQMRNMKGVHLKDFFPEWTPAWYCTINGDSNSHTEIRHRENGGAHASFNNTVKSGVNIVTGHDHVADVRPYDDRRGRRYGVRHGMGADSARDPQFVNYLEGRKPSWQSGMAVLTYKNGVLLMPELALRWDDNSFQFRGEIIKV